MTRNAATIAAAVCAAVFSGSAAAAQRTFVASYGLDTNPCSVTQPCRSFATAMTQTAANGEIVVLDSAGYGPVTIAQAVTIVAPSGVYAGISVPAGQSGVTVGAGPSDHVFLRGLTINGQGGAHGIRVVSGQVVHIESCTVSNMGQDGIRIEGADAVYVAGTVVSESAQTGLRVLSGVTTSVQAKDSRFTRSGVYGVGVEGGSFDGAGLTIEGSTSVGLIAFRTTPGALRASLTDSLLDGNDYGFVAFGAVAGASVRAAAVRVTASRNSFAGFEANTGGGVAILTVTQSAAVGNGSYGITALNGATATVSASTSSGNTGADLYQSSGGILRTSGTNSLTGRGGPDVSGALTPNPLQ